jgi:hypothetical protein
MQGILTLEGELALTNSEISENEGSYRKEKKSVKI